MLEFRPRALCLAFALGPGMISGIIWTIYGKYAFDPVEIFGFWQILSYFYSRLFVSYSVCLGLLSFSFALILLLAPRFKRPWGLAILGTVVSFLPGFYLTLFLVGLGTSIQSDLPLVGFALFGILALCAAWLFVRYARDQKWFRLDEGP